MRRRQYLAALAMTGLAGCSTTTDTTTTVTTSTEAQTTQPPTTAPTETSTETATTTDSPTETSSTTSATTERTVEPGLGSGPGEYNRDAVRQQATTTTYTAIERLLDSWVGRAVHLEYARVGNAVEEREDDQGEEYQFLRLYTSPDGSNWTGDLAGHYYGLREIEEDDYLEVWGVVEGREEYESAAGATATGPWVTVVIAGPRESSEIDDPPY